MCPREYTPIELRIAKIRFTFFIQLCKCSLLRINSRYYLLVERKNKTARKWNIRVRILFFKYHPPVTRPTRSSRWLEETTSRLNKQPNESIFHCIEYSHAAPPVIKFQGLALICLLDFTLYYTSPHLSLTLFDWRPQCLLACAYPWLLVFFEQSTLGVKRYMSGFDRLDPK